MRKFCFIISLFLIVALLGCSKDNSVSPRPKTMIRAAVDWTSILVNFPQYRSEPDFLALSMDSSFFSLSVEELENYKNGADWYIDIDYESASRIETIGGAPYNVTEYKDFNLPLGEYYYLLKGHFWGVNPRSFFIMEHQTLEVKEGKNTIYIHGFDELGNLGILPPWVEIGQP